MDILIDSREQAPLKFKSKHLDSVIVQKLDYGDYRVVFKDNFSPKVAFERKSISDLFGTLGKGYKRFKREIIRSQEDKALLIIIIEGTLSDILKGIDYSKQDGNRVAKQLFTIMVRYHVPFVCCANRKEMSRYIIEFFESLGREHIRKKNNET